MSANKFISCNNYKINFEYNDKKYSLTREYVENIMGIYWFAGNLYELIINKLSIQ